MRKLLPLVFSVTLIFMFSMNAFAQQKGKTLKVSTNQELIEAHEDPTITHAILQPGYYEYLDLEVFAVTTVYWPNGGGNRAECGYVVQPGEECWEPTSGWYEDIAVAYTTGATGPPPDCPDGTTQKGVWSVVGATPGNLVWLDGPGGSVDPTPTDYNQYFRVDAPGAYTLKYDWDPPYTGVVQADYNFYDDPDITELSSNSPQCEQSGNYQAEITWDYDVATDPEPDIDIEWTVVGPDGTTHPTHTTPGTWTLSKTQCGSYDVTLSISNGTCDPVEETITVEFYDDPEADAGEDGTWCMDALPYQLESTFDIDCDLTAPITASYNVVSQPSGSDWTIYNQSTSDPTTYADFSVDQCGTYVVRYTVEHGPCVSTSDVTIDFYDQATPDAGPDDDVCMDNLPYTLSPDPGVSCFTGDYTTAWTKVSGTGDYTFTGNDVSVDECGPYVFRYAVTHGPCGEVYDDVTINFWEEPEFVTETGTLAIPTDVCGYKTGDFYLAATADSKCEDIDTDWDWDAPSATALDPVFSETSENIWTIEVFECGDWTFYFEATNGDVCYDEYEFDITFHERPAPGIAHTDGGTAITGDEVFYCSSVDYYALDLRDCDITPLVHTWTVTGGEFEGGGTTASGTSVTVNWNNLAGGSLTLESDAENLEGCDDEVMIEITKKAPTLAGQVKYWNEFETYMPTPFPTDLYGTYPHDYFYVTLYEGSYETEIETDIVQPRLMEDLTELLSYFEFTIEETTLEQYGCDAEFELKVWDGGLEYLNYTPPANSPTYLGATYTYNNWGGVNATDALAIQLMYNGGHDLNSATYNYTWVGDSDWDPYYGYYSHSIADVNSSNTYTNGGITALDALTANYRSVGLIANYPYNANPDTMFTPNFRVTGRFVDGPLPTPTWPTPFNYPNATEDPHPNDLPFTHSLWDYTYFHQAIDHKYTSNALLKEDWADKNYINIYYEAIGDVNASYVPTSGGVKAAPSLNLVVDNQMAAQPEDVVTIPISIDHKALLGAITLDLNYRNDLIEVIGVNYGEDFHYINHEEGVVRIGWFSEQGMEVPAHAAIAQIEVKVLADIEPGTALFELNANTELADVNAQPIAGITLKTTGVTTDMSAVLSSDLNAKNYPNPFKHETIISYVLPEAGDVKVEVFNKMGQHISTIVDQPQNAGSQTVEFSHKDLKPGVYFYKITLDGMNKDYSVTESMIVIQ